jgi:anti-sigma regulatory factor (Ser/Thr protein kinase)
MTGHRAASPVTTEVNHPSHDDLLTTSSPESMWQVSTLLAAAPFAGMQVGHAPAQHGAMCVLGPRAESVKAARDFARSALSGWGMPELTDVAELVVSELVTNALRHGMASAAAVRADQPVRLKLLAQSPLAMCMVSDPGSEIPVRRDSGLAAECGRGLQVVEACSVRWGWHLLDEGGKIVWALLR